MSGRVLVFDTTLRDGEQSPGCSMHGVEKVRLARQLERLGVDVIEAGFPAASIGERESVRAVANEVACTVAALCRTREEDIRAAAKALEGAARPRIHTFIATSDLHLAHKLKMSREEALRQAVAAVRFALTFFPEVEFSAEDASRSDYGFLREVVAAVHEAGAAVVNIPDTVGYALPDEYGEIFAKLTRDVPGEVVLTADVAAPKIDNELREKLNQPVAILDPSVRAANCLNNANITTVGELAQKTEQEMLRYRNFGKKSLNEIKAKLQELGLSLGMKFDPELLKPAAVVEEPQPEKK